VHLLLVCLVAFLKQLVNCKLVDLQVPPVHLAVVLH
jgi:hypothetical protein